MLGEGDSTAAVEVENAAKEAGSMASQCHTSREYTAFPFSVLMRRLLSDCGSTAAILPCSEAHKPSNPGQRSSSTERILLLLPLCRSCVSSTTPQVCAASGFRHEGYCGSFSGPQGHPKGLKDVPCICSSCTSTLLLLLLLRLGIQRLADARSTGVLFCGSDDVPEKQRNFFPLLLSSDHQWPWSNSTSSTTNVRHISFASHTADYFALSRIGYKLLPRPGGVLTQRAKQVQGPSPPRLPPILQLVAELPEALERPPDLLLFLQPSRWLKLAGQLSASKTTALQQITDKKSYGLYLAVLLRALALRGESSSTAHSGSQDNAMRCPRDGAASDVQQYSVPRTAVVTECFLCCPRCCWRCTGQLRVTLDSRVPLCCLELSEWLYTLRSRFSHVFLLFSGSGGPHYEELRTQDAVSSDVSPRGPVLFVADVSDPSPHENCSNARIPGELP